MSAGPGSHPLRIRMARAFAALLGQHSHQSIADCVGVAQTTVSRRAEDLHAWPADDLLALAVGDPDLCDAVVAYLRGDQGPEASPLRATRDLFESLALSGQWTQRAAEVLADGRVDPDEARGLLPLLRQRRKLMEQVEADLRAVAGDE